MMSMWNPADGDSAWESALMEAGLAPESERAAVEGAPDVAGFEIIARLGAGASGEVWLADELESDRTVALKILHRNGAAGGSEEVMQREFRILAKLIHPNLVVLYHGVVTADGRQGLAMEWIDGRPLDVWLRQRPGLTLTEKLELFHGIVRGVAFLHDHGVIHRDLKPANVMVDDAGVAKIVDFGLARLHRQETASVPDGGSVGVAGTLHFMAPEQAANGRGSRAMPVDVYALGLMLHRILLGRWLVPMDGTAAETLARVLHPPALDFRGAGRHLPRDLRSILRQSLATDPAERYHHARDLEADLTRFSAKLPVAARRHTVMYLTATFLRRQARRSAVAGVLVLAGLIAGAVIYRRQRAVAERNEANLRYAYSLTAFTLRQLSSELRTGAPENESKPTANDLPGAAAGAHPVLPLNRAGELDLRYYRAMLTDLRAASAESHAHYSAALTSIQPALDLYSTLALESPQDPKRLLDAARTRLGFARLLGKVGRNDAAGNEARKALLQVDRLADWPGFDPAPLPTLRCDALRLLALQAYGAGDFAAAVRLSREMLRACEALPEGLLVRPENETLPRLAVGAYDLAVHAIAAGPANLPEARREIDRATAFCRTAQAGEPGSFALACGLARCLHAQALLSLAAGNGDDLRPFFREAAELMLAPPKHAERVALPQIQEISVTATSWAGKMLGSPDLVLANESVELAQRFTVYIYRNGIEREDIVLQRSRIHLYRSELASRAGDRSNAARLAAFASGVLRRRLSQQPDRLPLVLLTAEALHRSRALADLPEARWNDSRESQLEQLLGLLREKEDKLTPAQREELAALR